MKVAILILTVFAALVAFTSCDQKKAQQTTTDVKETVPDHPGTKPEKPKEVYQMVGYQKTACYGKCPVYQVKLYNDGTAIWEGKRFVDRMGEYKAKVSKATLDAIKQKAYDVGYFDFYEKYPVKHRVADLPSTITYMRVGDVVKSVNNTHEGPEKLAEFEKYLEEVIAKLEWVKVPTDK